MTTQAKTNDDMAIYQKGKKSRSIGSLTYHVMFSWLESMTSFQAEMKLCVLGKEQNLDCENF